MQTWRGAGLWSTKMVGELLNITWRWKAAAILKSYYYPLVRYKGGIPEQVLATHEGGWGEGAGQRNVGQTKDNRLGSLTLMDGHSWRQIWLISGVFHWEVACSSAINGPASTTPVGKYRSQKSGVGKEKVWKTEESNTVAKCCNY